MNHALKFWNVEVRVELVKGIADFFCYLHGLDSVANRTDFIATHC